MTPMIAIHQREEGRGFTPRWIECCREWGVEYRLVDGFASDLMQRLDGCRALLWHFSQNEYHDLLAAQPILRAVESRGLRVFPDLAAAWHFDDKLAQKYVFEALDLPHIPTYCFYFEEEALAWIRQASYPFVWKLRRGAGSANVRLVRDRAAAEQLCRQAFGGGFNPVPKPFGDFRNRARHVESWSDLWQKLKRRPALLRQNRRQSAAFPREMGYFLAQEFIAGNEFDTRVTVIGGRAWAFRRAMRSGDFRASGSGSIAYDPQDIDPRCLAIARDAAAALGTVCIAFDFLIDRDRGPLLVEMSYGFVADAIADCPGHWDRNGQWCPGPARPEDAMLRELLEDLD